jgi:uncharacterized OB-fold protein
LREDLLQFDPPRLMGSRCEACGTAQFPARDFCPACRADCAQIRLLLSEHGTVFSYTVVHQSPIGRTPYVLAYVDLVDEVRVLARLEDLEGELRIGMPVQLRLQQVRVDDGIPVIGYVFMAAAAPQREV